MVSLTLCRNGKVEGMGITHPSVKGQEAVVRKAYARGGLDMNRTAYAELHGTGTPVGDPIEVRAVSNALNDTRSREKPLLLGAVSSSSSRIFWCRALLTINPR
jgi:acyl transferase domain-containing protein